MSHLSILPTVLRDAACLEASLESLGLQPQRGGELQGFGFDAQQVEVWVLLTDDLRIGWQRQADGQLALVADLQRLTAAVPVQRLLSQLTRTYAARAALGQLAAEPGLAGAEVVLVS